MTANNSRPRKIARSFQVVGVILSFGVAFLIFGTIYHMNNPDQSNHFVHYLGYSIFSTCAVTILFGAASYLRFKHPE